MRAGAMVTQWTCRLHGRSQTVTECEQTNCIGLLETFAHTVLYQVHTKLVVDVIGLVISGWWAGCVQWYPKINLTIRKSKLHLTLLSSNINATKENIAT